MDIPIELQWRDLNLCMDNKNFSWWKCQRSNEKKIILNNVSGNLKSGQLVAVLGASGAGKTTLLACIAQRFRGPIQGEITINGISIDRKTMTKISCFVPQFDITIDSLTPTEHLYFMGELKFDRKWSKARKNQRIEYLLREIGLRDVANTRISRLSGGERKKLNLATDLLTDPLILVCDEPTTGLDSFNARTVIKTLKDLAEPHAAELSVVNENGFDAIELQMLSQRKTPKAIICSIHQPTSDIFQCFSHIILMHNGRCVFQGTSQEASDHFARLGFICPVSYNPADFYINLLSDKKSNDNNKIAEHERIDRIVKNYTYHPKTTQYRLNLSTALLESHNSLWVKQVWVLFWRSILNSTRNYQKTLTALFYYLIPFATFGLLYSSLTTMTQATIQNMQGFFFILSCEIIFSSFYRILFAYFTITPLLRRETTERIYTFSAYYVSTILTDLPFLCIRPLCGLLITFLLGGLNWGVWFFVEIWITLAVLAFTSTAYGLMMFGIFRAIILEAPPVFNMFFSTVSGVYGNLSNYPILKYTSVFFYANEAMSIMFWRDVTTIECPPDYPEQCVRNGIEVLERISYSTDSLGAIRDLAGLAALGFLMHFFAFIGIRRYIRSVGYY